MLYGSSPIFATDDVVATVQFYKDVLGFASSWTWGEPPTFGAATWGKATIMFGFNLELASKVEGLGHWFDVEDVNGLYAQHVERGAMIVSPIEDKPWGRREYTVREINGYHLRFAGDPTYTPKGTGVFPAGVEIVRRMPTAEEHQRVAGSAFYKDGVPTGTLERTWRAVVATDPSGEVIGTTRIIYDSPGWFSIWDVAVSPDWQGKRIGTAMMEAALEIVREESPGAFVYLFTFKEGFYERLGFEKGSVQTLRV